MSVFARPHYLTRLVSGGCAFSDAGESSSLKWFEADWRPSFWRSDHQIDEPGL